MQHRDSCAVQKHMIRTPSECPHNADAKIAFFRLPVARKAKKCRKNLSFTCTPAGVNLQEYEQKNGEAPKRRTSVTEERQRNTDYGS